MIGLTSFAQKINRIEPPNWWVGMENTQLELMVYGKSISDYAPVIEDKKIELLTVKRTENKNYLFITLDVSKSEVGTFKIDFKKKGKRKPSKKEKNLMKKNIAVIWM